MKTKKIYYILLTALLFITALRSQAAMTFLVDTDAKEFSFIGAIELDINFIGFTISSTTSASSPTGGNFTPTNDLFVLSNDDVWTGDFGFNDNFDFLVGNFVNVTVGDPVTLTGTGATASYAGWSADAIAYIDNLAISGGTLNIVNGASTTDSISVAVPEPRGYATLMALGTVACLCYLRRRRCS